MSNVKRMYGFFTCPTCSRGWESSWAWCHRNTDKPSSGQQCQTPSCPKTYIKPYRVERLKCSICGSDKGCSCHDHDHDDFHDDDDDDFHDDFHDDEHRHVDPAKPHRSDLCESCIRGSRCQYR